MQADLLIKEEALALQLAHSAGYRLAPTDPLGAIVLDTDLPTLRAPRRCRRPELTRTLAALRKRTRNARPQEKASPLQVQASGPTETRSRHRPPIAVLMGFGLYDSLRGTHHKRAHDTGAEHRHTHRRP